MKEPLKRRLQRGEICTGTFLLFLAGADVAEFFAGLGLDFLFLDMEHGSFDLSRIRETIAVASAHGTAPLVRVPEVQYHLVTRALDAGAEGIIAPRVETRRQCEDLVRFARYGPDGERGISTFAGHNRFRPLADVPGFIADRNREILLVAQIETRAGLENRDEILSVPGIDACLVGTGDLAMSMGHAGQVNHPAVRKAAEEVFQACRDRGLIFTVPLRAPEDVDCWQQMGLTMLALSSDGGMLLAGAKQFLSRVKRSGG